MPSSRSRLRSPPLDIPFHIVLVEPEIPPNTGNIARLAAATASPLHLVGPLGFRVDEQSVRRAGVDYWHLVDLTQHLDFAHFAHAFGSRSPGGNFHFFSAHGAKSYLEADFKKGDAIIFGKESVGLPEDLLAKYPDRIVGIPTLGNVRSLNLANAVSIGLYEALRATNSLHDTYSE